jgi:hypothetical protein
MHFIQINIPGAEFTKDPIHLAGLNQITIDQALPELFSGDLRHGWGWLWSEIR